MTSIINIIINKTIIIITALSNVLHDVYFYGHSLILLWYSSFKRLCSYRVRCKSDMEDFMQLLRQVRD